MVKLKHVDRPVLVEKYISPPEYLLMQLQQCADEDIPIMSKDSTWGDMVDHILSVQYKFLMCKAAAKDFTGWVKEIEQINAEP